METRCDCVHTRITQEPDKKLYYERKNTQRLKYPWLARLFYPIEYMHSTVEYGMSFCVNDVYIYSKRNPVADLGRLYPGANASAAS